MSFCFLHLVKWDEKNREERQKLHSEARACEKRGDSLSSSEMLFTPSHRYAHITELDTRTNHVKKEKKKESKEREEGRKKVV